jgi:nucleoid-associated protein YgaU
MSFAKFSLVLLILSGLLTSCSTGEQEDAASSTDVAAEEETLDMLSEFEGEDFFALEDEALDESFLEGDGEVLFGAEEMSGGDEVLFAGEDEILFGGEEMGNEEQASENLQNDQWQQPQTPRAAARPVIQGNATYTVNSGDTLMYVAYKKYGDYSKWRSIARMNGMSGGQSRLERGMTLQLDPSMIRNLPELRGRAYVIKRGDSLSRISRREYGSIARWKELWQHNSVMIKDPNLIFAGFQMHLLPDGTVAMNL